jgi:hypothetical protein
MTRSWWKHGYEFQSYVASVCAQSEDIYRLCFLCSPEVISIGLAEQLTIS